MISTDLGTVSLKPHASVICCSLLSIHYQIHFSFLLWFKYVLVKVIKISLRTVIIIHVSTGHNNCFLIYSVLSEELSTQILTTLCEFVQMTTDKIACARVFQCLALQTLKRTVLAQQVTFIVLCILLKSTF